MPMPETLVSRSAVMLTTTRGTVPTQLRGDQAWPLPECAEMLEMLDKGSTLSNARTLGKMVGQTGGPEAVLTVVRLQQQAEAGDNHIVFLSRLYALMHATAVTEAVGGRWVAQRALTNITLIDANQHWAATLDAPGALVILLPFLTTAMKAVALAAAESDWPVRAVLPETGQQPVSLGRSLPEGVVLTVLARGGVDAVPLEEVRSAMTTANVL